MRGTADFHDLAAYRGFIDEIVSRRNAQRQADRLRAHHSAGVARSPHLGLRGGTRPTQSTPRLNLLLNELRLPAIKLLGPHVADQSDKKVGRRLASFTIAEHEIAERRRPRIERHLVEVRLSAGKTFDNFGFEAVPMIYKAQVTALAAGDGGLGKGTNLLLFGPPGGGKSHLAAAIGLAFIENGWRVLFTRTTDLVQKLEVARRELNLEAAIDRVVHHATFVEMNVESYRRRTALERNAVPDGRHRT